MTRDIRVYCASCDICQKTQAKGRVKDIPLDFMPRIDIPFKRVAVDLVGPIHPPSEEKHTHILTVIDVATRFPEAIPLKKTDSATVAEALLAVFSRMGLPEEIQTDNGGTDAGEAKTTFEYVVDLKNMIYDTCKLAHNAVDRARKTQKMYHDKKSAPRKFSVGDKVLLLLPTTANKLQMQ
nr:hypothetical protein BaRGS_012573 [Batillaria attramentaria]